jgi:hypothetical protein
MVVFDDDHSGASSDAITSYEVIAGERGPGGALREGQWNVRPVDLRDRRRRAVRLRRPGRPGVQDHVRQVTSPVRPNRHRSTPERPAAKCFVVASLAGNEPRSGGPMIRARRSARASAGDYDEDTKLHFARHVLPRITGSGS